MQTLKSRLGRKLLGPATRALLVQGDAGVFAVDPEDMGVGRTLRRRGWYAREELQRLAPYVTPESRVLVVGAHLGSFAIPLSRLCREVIAIEANPATFELLGWNVALNAAHNCRILHLAASDKAETLEFLMNRTNSGGSKRKPKVADFVYYHDRPATVSVRAASLDQELTEREFSLIVMDIEGSEVFALRGMQAILAASRALAVEFTPHHLANVSGVSVADFLATIRPHFTTLTIPSLGRVLTDPADFEPVLQGMYDRNQVDDGLIFQKR